MTILRKLGALSLCLSLLDGLAGLADPDGAFGTAAEIAAMTALLGAVSPDRRPPADKTDPAGPLFELVR